MTEPVQFKAKGDYSEHLIVKDAEGARVECFNVDAMTEEQFKKYCRDTGVQWFQRSNMTVG